MVQNQKSPKYLKDYLRETQGGNRHGYVVWLEGQLETAREEAEKNLHSAEVNHAKWQEAVRQAESLEGVLMAIRNQAKVTAELHRKSLIEYIDQYV